MSEEEEEDHSWEKETWIWRREGKNGEKWSENRGRKTQSRSSGAADDKKAR